MTVSMRVLSAGDGYEYLLRTVAAGDGDRSLSTPLTQYYTEEGTPPGFCLGAGLSYLGDGQLAAGGRVSETSCSSWSVWVVTRSPENLWARRTAPT